MKKILILVSLVALVASGLFAQVTLNGKIEYGVQQGLDGKTPFISDPDARIEGNIVADDANTGYFRLRLNDSGVGFLNDVTLLDTNASGDADAVLKTSSTSRFVYFDRAHFTTNYLKAFGLGMEDLVTVTGKFGLEEFNLASVGNVTSYDTTKRFAHNFGTVWGTAQTVEVLKMVKLTVATSFADYAKVSGSQFFVDAVVTVPNAGPGTVKGEVAYILPSAAIKDAQVNIEAAYEMTGLVTGLTLTPAAAYNLTLAEKTNDKVVGAAKVAYDTDLFGVYLDGGAIVDIDQDTDNKTNDFVYAPIAFGASYSKLVGADLGLFLDLSKDETQKVGGVTEVGVLDSFDGSVWVAAGKAKFRVGYYMVPDKQKGVATRNAEDKFQIGSSIYFNASMSF